MVERRRPKQPGGDYFPLAGKSISFIPSGCALLDGVLGGGWPLGRVSNIVGDKSAGKTLLAIEACANFARKYPKGNIWYRESEAAFDEEYAYKLGLPLKRMDFGPDKLDSQWDTVEDVFEDLGEKITEATDSEEPGLYIIDSLDALSDREELKRDIDKGSYGTAKAKLLSELFRRQVRPVKRTRIHLMVISQVREKIGVMFGEKKGRSGGKALDFYASQILWLSHLKTLTQTVGGAKRATAVRILANCKKNKISLPFRRCEFTIRFGYGIDDIEASVEWLGEVKMLDRLGIKAVGVDAYLDELADLSQTDYMKQADIIRQTVLNTWGEVEDRFTPTRRKYV